MGTRPSTDGVDTRRLAEALVQVRPDEDHQRFLWQLAQANATVRALAPDVTSWSTVPAEQSDVLTGKKGHAAVAALGQDALYLLTAIKGERGFAVAVVHRSFRPA